MARFERGKSSAGGLPEQLGTATEELRSLIERQVEEILRAGESRVAEIETRALQRAAQVEREAQRRFDEVLRSSIDRTTQMLDALDAFETQANGLISSLRNEVEALASDLRARTTSPAATDDAPVGESSGKDQAVDEESRQPDSPNGEGAGAAGVVPVGPDSNGGTLEVRDAVYQQLLELAYRGKPRAEAERYLTTLEEGDKYLPMLDEIYAPPEKKQVGTTSEGRRGLRRRRSRRT
jgi:hypothetical protein